MTFFQSLLPWNTPENLDHNDHLKVLQEQILHYLFLGGSIVGLFFIIAFLVSPISKNSLTSAFSAVAFFAISTAFFLLRRIGYWTRSIVALVLFYILANMLYFTSGWTGLAIILLLVFSFLSTALLYQGPSRIGLFLSVTTLLVWATLRFINLVPGSGLTFSINTIGVDLLIALISGTIFNLVISQLKTRVIEIYRQNQEIKTEQHNLQEQMDNQKAALERRVNQLRTAAEINKSISAILDPLLLIRQVSDSIKERFGLYYVGIFLVDSMKEFAVLQYGTGDAGRKMMAARHRLAVGGYSMIGWTTHTRKARIALDTGVEAVRFDNPYLPNTRSELAIPIATASTMYGAMTIQSDQANYFDENDIVVLQSIADSLAIALENNSSFESTQKALEEIRVLNKAYVQHAWGEEIAIQGELHAEYENPETVEPTTETHTVQIPLYLRDEVIGEINLEINGETISPEETEFLQALSVQTTGALENARLLSETQRTAANEQKLNSLSEQFSRALTIEEILKTAVTEFGKLPSVSEASIALIPPEDTNLGKPLSKREE